MNGITSGCCLQLPVLLLFSVLLRLIPSGLADGSSSSNTQNGTNGGSAHSSGSSLGTKILIGCLVLAVIAFSIILFKIWQKKKREEQHARLLKLFEDDDELEVELGIRD